MLIFFMIVNKRKIKCRECKFQRFLLYFKRFENRY